MKQKKKYKKYKKYRLVILFFITSLICLCSYLFPNKQIAIATIKSVDQVEVSRSLLADTSNFVKQNQEEQQQEDLAVKYYNFGQYRSAIELWLKELKQTSDKNIKATLYSNLGSAYRQIGNSGQAVKAWEESAKIYQSIKQGESHRVLARILTEEAQDYNALGQSRIAIPLLHSAIDIAKNNKDLIAEAAARGVLGNAYLALGDFTAAIASHQESLSIATKLQNPSLISIIANNLGNALNTRYQHYLFQVNLAAQEGDDQEEYRLSTLAKQDAITAQSAYKNSVQESEKIGGIYQAKALLSLARFLQQQPSTSPEVIRQYSQQIISILENVPDSHNKAYTLINLAGILTGDQAENDKIHNLSQAIATAEKIGDQRAESFALTALGAIYQQMGNFSRALELTQKAELVAQRVNATDSLYRALAQAGSIYKAQGVKDLAIISYRQAIAALQTIRGDIIVASKDLQFDLRDSVEPVYRELMSLLLAGNSQIPHSQAPIQEALQVSELLQLNELQNFFGDECVHVARHNHSLSQLASDQSTAVINSIFLNDRTYMIMRLSNGTLKSYPVEISGAELTEQVNQLRFKLEDISTDEYLTEAQKIYDLLIRPLIPDLTSAQINTLVFINDGVLRNIPMAALHDGKQFLVEKYAIANTLNLNLTPTRQSTQHPSTSVVFGLSAEVPPFAPLPYVEAETVGVQKILAGKRFLDREFTLENLSQQIDQNGYAIVHLATHGKFGTDSDNTFLQLFNQRISLNEFEGVLRKSKQEIELLTLSACQTATGDSRAILGLAGVALRSGVQSILASLWFINDADTVTLMKDFYTQLHQSGLTKAEALRQAQLKIIADPNGHPAIWSPFVLVGNWE